MFFILPNFNNLFNSLLLKNNYFENDQKQF